MGFRNFAPQVAACPGCGRTTSTVFQELARDIETYLAQSMPEWRKVYPGVERLNVAVMGCIVNGPGESKHANIGISLPGTGEAPAAPVFVDGVKTVTLRGPRIGEEFKALVNDYIAKRYGSKSAGGGVERVTRPPLPPFTEETAAQKARMAEDAWNSRDPARVALGYSENSRWRNRAEFFQGRPAIEAFLTRKWNRGLDYRLMRKRNCGPFTANRIAVRFAYEWRDNSGSWFRAYGNEDWEFDEDGLMRVRLASINDLPIREQDRLYHWPLGRRPER